MAEAEAVVEELRAALHDVGVTLPTLGLDLVTYARRPPDPLIELGRCPRDTARRLAAALRERGSRT
ncbi:hypothetical protein [Streptomyces sp. HNM0574]|uniref:hypothetical protein n=1 Tax=Streptomyces sp. HNM0574 TaxID=2714954 RepID=UPI001F0ED3DB|nr:hypothetical protein [Streptomyces sp. HNM0574]